MDKLQEIIEKSKVIVHKGRYGYLKTEKEPITPCFLVAKDIDEITVIVSEEDRQNIEYINFVGWFKLIEIKVSEPFTAKGFLAKIAKTIADQDLNVLVVSTFSKDYILIREEASERAINALSEIGFSVAFV
jgi:hypothetical protein